MNQPQPVFEIALIHTGINSPGVQGVMQNVSLIAKTPKLFTQHMHETETYF